MGIIRELDYDTAVLVAAGEMIERPASIVKELVENSIDAGAKKLTVEIQNGGITLIRCSDNGCGMEKDDLPLAIKRNATSKIRTSEDIAKIMTLGFRGEALASIAAVADLRIRSKRASDDVGCELEIHPGMASPTLTDVPMSDGTTIIVENLFANIPARRKFLKKDSTEASHISDLFERLALSNPGVAMTLIIDGKPRYTTPGDGNLRHTIYSIFGNEFAGKLIELDYMGDVKMYGGGSVNIKVTGFIGTPDNSGGTRQHQIFFINSRHVKSKCLQAALEQSYVSYIEASRFPACVIFVSMPPEFVDVNIHPTKLEVKFASDKPVFEAVYYAVRGALERYIPRPKPDFAGKDSSEVSYEMMKMLNAFTPIEERGASTSPKPVYNNQRNVKAGQLSISPQPIIPPDSAVITIDGTETRMMDEMRTHGDVAKNTLEQAPPPHMDELELLRKDTPSEDSKSKQELFLEELPPELDGTMTAKDGNPPMPQKMYLGKIAPEVDEMVSGPRQKCVVSDKMPSRMSDEEFEALRREYMTSGGEKAQNLPDIPSPSDIKPSERREIPQRPVPEYKILGEAFLSYVFVEVGDKVLIIDKHAAHERIIFEDLKANLKRKLYSGDIPRQMLLSPITVELTPALISAAEDYFEDICAIGFDFSLSDHRRAEISAIPAELGVNESRAIFETIAEQLANGTGSAAITRDTLFEKALYQASCKAAIKIGREYDEGHLRWICDKLLVLDDIKVCPHGRPVAFEMSKSDIERQFKRI